MRDAGGQSTTDGDDVRTIFPMFLNDGIRTDSSSYDGPLGGHEDTYAYQYLRPFFNRII